MIVPFLLGIAIGLLVIAILSCVSLFAVDNEWFGVIALISFVAAMVLGLVSGGIYDNHRRDTYVKACSAAGGTALPDTEFCFKGTEVVVRIK